MEAFWKKYKKQIAIGIVVLVIVIIILVFATRSKRPKDVTYQVPVVKPDGTISYEGEESYNAGDLTTALYNDMSGYNLLHLGKRDMNAYNQLAALNDPQLIAVYNDWNYRYFSKADSKTVFQKLAGEKEYSVPGWMQNPLFGIVGVAGATGVVGAENFASLRDNVLEKAKRLNLYK